MASEQYRTIVADPPWAYSTSRQGAAAKHYPTMSAEALRALPVRGLAAADAVLLLWATWPKLDEAMALIEAWDFRYKTALPWIKVVNAGERPLRPQYGIGFWVRGCSEVVLIGVRGKARPTRAGYCGLISENFGHSRKPDNIHEFAEQFPGPYLELFSRRARPNWTALGNAIDGRDIREVLRGR